MRKQVIDIESILHPLLTRRRTLILREAGVSEDLLDADLYRDVRDMKRELKRKDKAIAEKDKAIAEKDQKIAEHEKTIEERDKTIAEKDAEILKLKQQLGKLDRPVATSMNTSLPPSRNPIGIRHTNSLRKKSGKPNGGQKGHEGSTLYRNEHPGKVELCTPMFCPCCGEPVSPVDMHEVGCRQVIDLPSPVIPVVTDYILLEGTCKCGHKLQGEYPEGVNAPVSYGPNVQAAVAYLNTKHSVPFKRMTEVMEYLFGIHMSEGTVSNILNSMRKKSKVGLEAIRKGIENSTVGGGDETGIRINGDGYWMWVFQTALLTYMFVGSGRAKEMIDKQFPDGLKNMILTSDRLSAYFNVEVKAHQDCLVHLLRNALYLTLLLPDEPWPVDFMELLRETIHEKHLQGASMELYDKERKKLDELLAREIKCPKEEDKEKYEKLERFKKQMIKHADNLLTFLKYEDVPADNNASERALRTVKTKMKVSGQFKTKQGAQTYANLHSIIQTAIKQGQNPFLALVEVAKYHPSKEE